MRRKILQGRGFCRLGSAPSSVETFSQAAALIGPTEHALQADLAFALGRCTPSDDRAARAAAEAHYQQAVGLYSEADPFMEAASLLALGYLQLKDGSYYQAIDTLNRASSITDSPMLREAMLGNLAECYAELGDWRQSISLAEEAVKLSEQIKNDGDRKTWLIDLGRAHLALGEYSQAEPYFRQALAFARIQKDQDGLLRCLNNLTQLALRRHDLNAAETYWKEEAALRLGAGGSYVSFDAASIAIGRKELTRAEQLFKEILNTKTNDSLRLTTQRLLGTVYWQENKLVEADRMFRAAISDAELVISQLPPEHRMSFLDVDTFYDSYVRFLVAQDKPLEALKIAERGRGQILSQALRASQDGTAASPFDLTTVQAALRRQNKIALAYSLTNEESFLWVITPKTMKVFRLPSHKTIADQIDAYRRDVVDHPRAIEDSSGPPELYKTLVQPAENFIPKGSRVVVITSKILSIINFEALIVPGGHPHYWIEEVEIETASSLALLAHSKPSAKTAARGKELFLLIAPIPGDHSLPVLKHAVEEMDRVRSHFPEGQETVISGAAAVPQSYRASQPGQYRLIHIDAHSLPSDLNPLDSYIVLSAAADHSYKLFAHDIEATPLHADLVTISACSSAGIRWYQGEGIVGLGWAFLRAGAHQVVASLWPVDDASTPQLMDDFYRELSQGKSASEALRDAKLNMLHSGGQRSKPYYWASLQLYTGF